jgi:hypothetical protein
MSLPCLDLLVRAGFFVGPYATGTVGSYCRFEVGNPGSDSLGVLKFALSGNGKMP